MYVPSHAECRQRLEGWLLAGELFWRGSPFKHATPARVEIYPALAEHVLALTDDEIDRFEADAFALIDLVASVWPQAAQLAACMVLPVPDAALRIVISPHRLRDIPGHKQAQVQKFIAAMGQPCAPVLEWCTGKGHLGRLLVHRFDLDALSLERDPLLCAAGARLARRGRIDARQRFVIADALTPVSGQWCQGRHVLALHACGALHRQLLHTVVQADSPALRFCPCCHYRGVKAAYVPFSPSALTLNADALRLAVTQTVTASAAQRRASRRAQAWKLAWAEFPPACAARTRGNHFAPSRVPGIALNLLPSSNVWQSVRARACQIRSMSLRGRRKGLHRAHRMRRFGLVRHAFRRPLELWLAHDMAAYLEAHGYRVGLMAFCAPTVTPRNLLLSARRA